MSIVKKVLVFGTFDGIHEGHRVFLRQAHKCGDNLIVAVAKDEVVEKLKGHKPTKDLGQRTKDLRNTGFVDEVIEGDLDLGSWGVIGKVKPNVIALGYDQGGLKEALLGYIREKGLEIQVKVMEAYRPEKYHSSLLCSEKL
ncbi:MAG: adenylyltransferase/cytidyltransferase family protein [bacterium]|nr:adenylyltransferase/cytidyltransferase family protein [bacterium]